jgi:cobalamin-dependent methionine synthase I
MIDINIDMLLHIHVLDPVNFLYDSSEDIWRVPLSLVSAGETEAVVRGLHCMGGEVAVCNRGSVTEEER